MPLSSTKRELRKFLGLTGYCRLRTDCYVGSQVRKSLCSEEQQGAWDSRSSKTKVESIGNEVRERLESDFVGFS